MAMIGRCAAGLVVAWASSGPVGAADRVVLREADPAGTMTRVRIELKATGKKLPAAPPGEARAKAPPPQALEVEARFAFDERVRSTGASGAAERVVRKVIQAAAAINAEGRPMSSSLRPEVAILLAERRGGQVVAVSPGGPMTWPELELVQGPGDPLVLPDLLPTKPVAVGDRWTVGTAAARSLSGYDALAANGLEATLEALDDASATVGLKGTIRGAALGGEGSVVCEGRLTFDRNASRVSRLTLERRETRKPNPVETGLDVASTLSVDRRPVEAPPELTDDALAALPADPPAEWELLLFASPDCKYSLRHDRDWHLFDADYHRAVLKRLDGGEVVAQCNLSAGPSVGRGRHQDPAQFRSDLRRALGTRFDRVLEAGEIEAGPQGGFRYRVVVRGHEGNTPILWYYYLIAAPDGDQLLATFTLGAGEAKTFADQDLRLIGSLEWAAPKPR